MKHILVPFLSPQDLDAIPNLVRYLRSQGPVSVFIAHSPSLGVSNGEATREVDKRIEDLTQAEAAAAARKDYAGAQQFATQVEEAKVSRGDILRNGWKSVSIERRRELYQEAIDKSFAALHPSAVMSRPLDEDAEDLIGVLSQLKARGWPASLPKNRFSVVFPQDAKEVRGQAPKADKTAHSEPAKPAPAAAPVDPKEFRRKQLSKYMAGKSAAVKLGISMEGKPYSEVVEEILKAEFPAA